MKIYLIAALFLAAALVVAHAEDVEFPGQDVELPEQQDQPEQEVNDSTEEDTEDPEETEQDAEESEDDDNEEEDPEKRRRRNTLSNISCLRLKQRRYCRHLFIRRLCAATCYVPPVCADKLSRISCHKLKGYGRCGSFTGRHYCRKTCRHCGPRPIYPCRRYALLNQLNRRQTLRTRKATCDRKGSFRRGWYRFSGLAGNRMPTRAPASNRCGTHAPGWMVGSYPRRNGQVVNRKVCFRWRGNGCRWQTRIKVKKCGRGRSSFFVFLLGPAPACHLRYCGNA